MQCKRNTFIDRLLKHKCQVKLQNNCHATNVDGYELSLTVPVKRGDVKVLSLMHSIGPCQLCHPTPG